MIEQIVGYDRVHQHHQVERPGGEGRGEGEEKRSGSKGRGEARGGQRRARPWQSTTSTSCRRGGTSSVNVRMLKSDRGRPVSEWRHVWTIEAGAAGGHPVLLIHAGRALWWYGSARKATYILSDDHDDRSERSEHDGTARPPSTAVPYTPVTQRGRPSDPIRSDPIGSDSNPIRSDPSAAQQSGRVVVRMIESIVVAVTPESLAAVGGYVTREGTD